MYSDKGVEIPKYCFYTNFSDIEKYQDYAIMYSHFKSELEELELEEEIEDTKNSIKEYEAIAHEEDHPTLDINNVDMEYYYRTEHLGKIFSLSNYKQVLFIDDFINKGGTIRYLNENIDNLINQEENSDIPDTKISHDLVTFFMFYLEEGEKYGKKEDRVASNFRVIEGTSGENYAGFKYRNTSAFSPFKRKRYQKEKESAIGVEKMFGRVQGTKRAENRNSKKVHELRKTMKILGKQALTEIEFKDKEKDDT